MADIKDWPALAKQDPEWVAATAGGPSINFEDFPDIPSLRAWILEAKSAMTAELGGSIRGVIEHDEQVPVRDKSSITCRIYQPETPSAGGSPLVVVYHGGGWCIGGLENEELLCRLLVQKLGLTVVNVEYRLAPEFRFPVPMTDCFDATKWAVGRAPFFGADTSKGFLLCGTSAGGSMAVVISHLWRDEALQPPITGTHLMIPFLVHCTHVPEKYKPDYQSWEQCKDAPILGQKAAAMLSANYIEEADSADPRWSALLFPSHKNMPPAYFQICGGDPLRDEALIYERILREDEGIKTKVDVYPGLPHGFWSIAPKLKSSQKFVEDSLKGVEWLLQQGK